MSKTLNILGLLFNFAGVVVLFLFGMPFRIVDIDVQMKALGDVDSVIGWLGLLAIMLGTLLQIWATFEHH